MNRAEFERLRSLQGKRITSDIEFTELRQARPNLVFDGISVENVDGWDVVLNGTYKPGVPAITYNFVLRGFGPICRIEVNGTSHPGVGRTHKHELRKETDSRLNLPGPTVRADIQQSSSPRQVWELLCKEAKIEHTGEFKDP